MISQDHQFHRRVVATLDDELALEMRVGRDGYQSSIDDIEPPLAVYEMIRKERRSK